MENCNCSENCPETTDLCKGAPINAHCVKSTQFLPCMEGDINDRLDVLLAKIDAKLCQVGTDDDEHTRDVICAMVQDTPTIDLNCDDGTDTMTANLIVSTGDDTVDRIMFWSGTDVRTRTLDDITSIIQDGIGDIYTDTPTIDFTYDSFLNQVTADVILSQTPGNELLALSDGLWAPRTIETGVVYGGEVTWSGTGLIYNVAPAGYYINFVFYQSPAAQITLSPGDPIFNRTDTFIVDTTGAASVLEGTPSANPVESPLDLGTQLRLSGVIVQANAIEASQNQCIYQEGSEWTIAVTGGFDSLSTVSPCFDTVSIQSLNPAQGDNILFTNPAGAIVPKVYGTLQLLLKSVITWEGGSLQLQWENATILIGSPVTIASGSYGFNDLDASTCQTVNIPINDFQLSAGDLADSLRVTVFIGNISFNFFIDNLCLSTSQLGNSSVNYYKFQNGTQQVASTNIVEFGGNLQHVTTLNTGYYKQLFTGTTIYDYPYEFSQQQAFQIGTGVASFVHHGAQDSGEPDFQNIVRVGINYTGAVYESTPDSLPGYMNDKIGYSLGVNWTGHGSFGAYTDNPFSKTGGIFFHTLDDSYTDMVTIYGKQGPTNNSDITIQPGETGFEDYRIAAYKTDGSIQNFKYGVGTFSATPTFLSGWDVDGNVVETSLSDLEITITADNGLTKSTTTNVQLGGTLLQDTTIDTDSNTLFISTAIGSNNALAVTSTSGTSIIGSATTGVAIQALSTDGTGASIQSTNGIGLIASSQNSIGFAVAITPSSPGTINTIAQFTRQENTTATNGTGGSLDFQVFTNSIIARLSNQIISKWTTVSDATRTSEFSITGVNSATVNILLTISGAGIFTLTQGLQNFADDAAAAIGNIPVNGLYRTASAVKIRVS